MTVRGNLVSLNLNPKSSLQCKDPLCQSIPLVDVRTYLRSRAGTIDQLADLVNHDLTHKAYGPYALCVGQGARGDIRAVRLL